MGEHDARKDAPDGAGQGDDHGVHLLGGGAVNGGAETVVAVVNLEDHLKKRQTVFKHLLVDSSYRPTYSEFVSLEC